MAITFVGAGSAHGAYAGLVDPDLPAGTQLNDILLVACGSNGSDTLACSGYTKKAEYTAGGGGMNLVVPIEMCSAGLASQTEQVTFERSKVQLDPTNYDGATYYFEIVTTTPTTTSYNVELYDVTNATVEATIATGTSALTYKRLRSGAWTPAAGNSTFAVRIDATTSANDVRIFAARIIVVQANATKTRLQIPLGSYGYSGYKADATTNASFDEMTGTTGYGQTYPAHCVLWKKEAAKLATIAAGTPWTLEAVLSISSVTTTASLALFNATDNVAVTGAEVSTTGATTPVFCTSADFADAATNFTDLDEFEVRVKTSSSTRYAYAYSANLYVKLTSLTKAMVYNRVACTSYAGTTAQTIPFQRALVDTSAHSGGTTWKFEATGIDASATPVAVFKLRYSNIDSGTGTGSTADAITLANTRSRVRSVDFTPTDDYNYWGYQNASVSNASIAAGFLIAELSITVGEETQATVFWKRHTGTETKPTVTGATDAITANVYAFRGVDTGADPWDAYDAGLATGAGSNAYFPSLTTATDGAVAIGVAATGTNNAYDAASVGYGNLTTPRGSYYTGTTLGNDCSFFMLYGTQTTAGTVGAPYGRQTALGPQFYVSTIGALKPAAAVSYFHLTIACEVASEANIVPDPVIASLSPVTGLVGITVTITGSDFGTAGVVKFGTTTATQVSYADTTIVVTVPTLTTGAKTVTVTPTSRPVSNGSTFTVTETIVLGEPIDTNPLRDGLLVVTIGGLGVTDALLPGLSWSTTSPGGFGEASLRLPATDPSGPYEYTGAVSKGSAVVISHGGTVLFQGEVTNDLRHATLSGGTAYYDIVAAGLWWKAGQRSDYCYTVSDGDYAQWWTKPGVGEVYSISTDGELKIALELGQSCAAAATASLYYWLDGGFGNTISDIDYVFAVVEGNVQAATWFATLSSSDSPWGTWTVEQTWTSTTIAAGTPFLCAIDSGARALRLRLYTTAAVDTAAADRYIRLTKLAVVRVPSTKTISSTTVANPTVVTTTAAHGFKTGDRIFISGSNGTSVDGWHTITLNSTSPTTKFTIPVNVASGGNTGTIYTVQRVDSAMASIALTTGLATSSVLDTAGVGNVNWSLVIRPHMGRADAIEEFAGLSPSPMDYAFWDDATFYCKTRPAITTGANSYRIDSLATAGIDTDLFADTEDSPTHVKVLYMFRDVDGGTSIYPDGTLLSVYRPEEPGWDDTDVVLDVWDQWADLSLTTAQAEDIGDQILAWIADTQFVGTITVATPTIDLADGSGTKTSAYIRAGDYIEDININSHGPMLITSCSVDADSGVVTLGIGENRADFVRRITRRSDAISKSLLNHPRIPRIPHTTFHVDLGPAPPSGTVVKR